METQKHQFTIHAPKPQGVHTFPRKAGPPLDEAEGRYFCSLHYITYNIRPISNRIRSSYVKLVSLFLLILLVISCNKAHAEIDLSAISMIESSGGKRLIGDSNQSLGVYQINVKGALADYNKYVEKTSPKQLLNPKKNKEIASWYLNRRIPLMLRFFKKPVTTKNILLAYNCGIGCVVENRMPRTSEVYLAKYSLLTGEAL